MPLSITVEPWTTVWLFPALAIGGCVVFVVIVTVAAGLLRIPSLTINCATYVPAASTVKVGLTILALLRTALLPGAPVVFKLHW